jgi:hypothetical protein
VDLVSQSLEKRGTPLEVATLRHLRDEFMYLQRAYRLEKIYKAAN